MTKRAFQNLHKFFQSLTDSQSAKLLVFPAKSSLFWDFILKARVCLFRLKQETFLCVLSSRLYTKTIKRRWFQKHSRKHGLVWMINGSTSLFSVFYIVDAVFKIDLHLWGLSVVSGKRVLGLYLEEVTELRRWFKPERGGGYSLWWPIRGGSARKGYLFQASGIWKGRDFTSWSI